MWLEAFLEVGHFHRSAKKDAQPLGLLLNTSLARGVERHKGIDLHENTLAALLVPPDASDMTGDEQHRRNPARSPGNPRFQEAREQVFYMRERADHVGIKAWQQKHGRR